MWSPGVAWASASAMFAAVDADARLWDAEGVWTSRQGLPHVYRWRQAWQVLAVGIGRWPAALALPVVLAMGLAALYPLVYLVHLASASAGGALTGRYVGALSWLMSPALMLGVVPRMVAAGVLIVLAVIVTVTGIELAKRPARRVSWLGMVARDRRPARRNDSCVVDDRELLEVPARRGERARAPAAGSEPAIRRAAPRERRAARVPRVARGRPRPRRPGGRGVRAARRAGPGDVLPRGALAAAAGSRGGGSRRRGRWRARHGRAARRAVPGPGDRAVRAGVRGRWPVAR